MNLFHIGRKSVLPSLVALLAAILGSGTNLEVLSLPFT
jgi:hypothetical protein